MKKSHKSIIIISVISCFCLSAIAYASFEKITSDSMVEIRKISKIENELDMNIIKSAFAGEQYVDDDGEVQMTEGIDVECSVDDLVKKYHSDSVVDMKNGSIFDTLSDTYTYYLPVKHNGDVVGMANIKIGKPVSEVEKSISDLNLDEEYKEELLQKAQDKEGKWYVASVTRYVEGEGYLMPEELQSKLEEAGITNVVDVKYASITDYADEAFCIKTEDDEYVIPINAFNFVPNVENRDIYSTGEVKASAEAVKSALSTE